MIVMNRVYRLKKSKCDQIKYKATILICHCQCRLHRRRKTQILIVKLSNVIFCIRVNAKAICQTYIESNDKANLVIRVMMKQKRGKKKMNVKMIVILIRLMSCHSLV